MTAQEVITLAQAGELRQLSPSIKNDDATVVGFINLGLIELYKRFTLRTEEAIITLVDGKTIYKLDGTDTDVVLSGNDLMYVIAAYGDGDSTGDYTTDDFSLPLNVEDNPYSVNTVGYDSVQVPLITDGATISLIYAAKPTPVDVNDLSIAIDVPDQFVEALLHYVGYRGHGSMDGEVQAENNTHYMRFEASCLKIKELGVGIMADDVNTDSRISTRGFA
jgi:hypothetical protein